MREALASTGDAIVTVRTAEQDETFHLSQRMFRLNTLEHRLVLIERLTTELRRQEVAVWKKAIRVINHELNNTIAPISSLFHSAKLAQAHPERHDRLGEIYETIEERLAFLRTFLESYAQFARLPPPEREQTLVAGDPRRRPRALRISRRRGASRRKCSPTARRCSRCSSTSSRTRTNQEARRRRSSWPCSAATTESSSASATAAPA